VVAAYSWKLGRDWVMDMGIFAIQQFSGRSNGCHKYFCATNLFLDYVLDWGRHNTICDLFLLAKNKNIVSNGHNG
jgi:hypothetical protein